MMKPLSFKIVSEHLLGCLFLSLLVGTTYSSTTSTLETNPTETLPTAPMTTVSVTNSPPENVNSVTVVTQNESSITLMWDKVNNILTYILQYNNSGNVMTENITASSDGASVTHVVSSLTVGTRYNFILFTVLDGVNSTGFPFEAVTAPENVISVTVVTQNESSITLKWEKVNSISTYILQYDNNGNGMRENITASSDETSVTHVVSSLTVGTRYNFILFTVLDGVTSTGRPFEAVTAPENVISVTVVTQNESSITLKWEKVDNNSTYILQYDNNGNVMRENITASSDETSVTHVVSSLTVGTRYNFILFTVFEGVNSTGHTFEAVTVPENVNSVTVVTQDKSSITLKWEKVNSISTYILQYNNSGNVMTENITASSDETSVTHVVSSLTAGTRYNFILFTVLDGVTSTGFPFEAVTAPESVISVTVVTQNESSITLKWEKVDNNSTYILQYDNNGNVMTENITASSDETSVTHVVSSLTAGTRYNFILFTVLDGVASTGFPFEAVTAPENVISVTVVTQNESSITLKWDKVNSISTYILQCDNNGNVMMENITASSDETSVTHVVSSLTAGTRYNFILFTVFEGVKSIGYTFEAVTAPENAKDVNALTQNETSITLQWKKVDNIVKYTLLFNGTEINVTATGQTPTKHTIPGLTSGTKYDCILFTLFENVKSSGVDCTAATVPSVVDLVRVTERSATAITLEWNVTVDKNWSYFLHFNGEHLQFHPDNSRKVVSHFFQSLKPGTEYPFSVITSFFGLNSTAYNDFTVTAMDCASVTWHVTNTTIQGMIDGLFSTANATYESQTHVGDSVSSNVTFTGLYPGATYNVTLDYEKNSKIFRQYDCPVTILPPDLSAHCEYWAGGYSVSIVWNKPDGVWTEVEVNVTGKTYTVNEDGKQRVKLSGFSPARTYEVSFGSLSGDLRNSEPFVFSCSTDPRGVIAGAVVAVLLFAVLACLAVFIFLKRPDIISRKKSFIGGSKLPEKKCKAISVAKFPDHFRQLSGDENRGFSEEYESLIAVGTEQTKREALLPENKPKNRFNNVLPYDWCRVRLTTSTPNADSDYINASYMPGYNSNREYIATQGPLPSTVNDFWRMVWEQRVKGIVMVTNCTEGGRTKCERYWPAESKPCLYGELLVITRYEQEEPNWTLREFMVKHKKTSEERTVKHFHFTVWPDHGVPQGTGVLIQFRELVRQHIQREGATSPTVVHCSAGVGRTGTIIALDVLLQQLEKERGVGIKEFVHKMRLNRPHMVQMESQYVFLHQCILDCLEPIEKTEENIYENADMIYENATALRELHQNT
uniref:receptor-type tyrosine-protein phosphatase H-like isoform X3 n=1 Tax=Scatophagus argus TaxID=75038 RepID=UPI001ED86008|nr:receptor-type tyrosine-protein phosphatase H-like isoform X3 [Scatophagus argus]